MYAILKTLYYVRVYLELYAYSVISQVYARIYIIPYNVFNVLFIAA